MSIAWGQPKSNYTYELLGQLFALTAVPAIITGFLACRAKTSWSLVKIIGVYALVLVLLLFLTIAEKIWT